MQTFTSNLRLILIISLKCEKKMEKIELFEKTALSQMLTFNYKTVAAQDLSLNLS